jgi:hypothetical protein
MFRNRTWEAATSLLVLAVMSACSGGSDESEAGSSPTQATSASPATQATSASPTTAPGEATALGDTTVFAQATARPTTTDAPIVAPATPTTRLPTAPTSTTTAVSATGRSAPATPTPPTVAATVPPAPPIQQEEPAPTIPPATPMEPAGTTTCDTPGSGGYDLLGYTVDTGASAIVLTARFAPIESGHNVLVGFTAAGSSKRVAGELFEDGSGVAQVQDLTTHETVYVDGAHEFAADHFTIVVPRQSVDASLLAGPVTVELKVDGPSAEVCAAA